MPSGTKLFLKLSSEKGESNGEVDISSAQIPVDMVHLVDKDIEQNQPLAYRFVADASVEMFSEQSRVVTLTISSRFLFLLTSPAIPQFVNQYNASIVSREHKIDPSQFLLHQDEYQEGGKSSTR